MHSDCDAMSELLSQMDSSGKIPRAALENSWEKWLYVYVNMCTARQARVRGYRSIPMLDNETPYTAYASATGPARLEELLAFYDSKRSAVIDTNAGGG